MLDSHVFQITLQIHENNCILLIGPDFAMQGQVARSAFLRQTVRHAANTEKQ